jgi:predicted N-acetyltransferase YhbS
MTILLTRTARETEPAGATLELVRATSAHVPEISRIAYEAFYSVSVRHGYAPDFPAPETAGQVMRMLVDNSSCFYGVVALLDGLPVGSNFLSIRDPVAGVGPLTVDPAVQGGGIGRTLMVDVLEEARHRGIASIRLLQDAFNRVSLSLYATLGFEQREAVALMEAGSGGPTATLSNDVRSMTADDLTAVEALSRGIYNSSRRGDAALAVAEGLPAFVRERGGQVTSYVIPGLFGHGVAATNDDMLPLLRGAVQPLPPPFDRVFVPLSNGRLFRTLLADGWRVVKVMNLMTVGPYERPEGTWLPSVLY